jgi:hypothetical protein
MGDPAERGGALGCGRPKLGLIRYCPVPRQGLKLAATKIQFARTAVKLIPAA